MTHPSELRLRVGLINPRARLSASDNVQAPRGLSADRSYSRAPLFGAHDEKQNPLAVELQRSGADAVSATQTSFAIGSAVNKAELALLSQVQMLDVLSLRAGETKLLAPAALGRYAFYIRKDTRVNTGSNTPDNSSKKSLVLFKKAARDKTRIRRVLRNATHCQISFQ